MDRKSVCSLLFRPDNTGHSPSLENDIHQRDGIHKCRVFQGRSAFFSFAGFVVRARCCLAPSLLLTKCSEVGGLKTSFPSCGFGVQFRNSDIGEFFDECSERMGNQRSALCAGRRRLTVSFKRDMLIWDHILYGKDTFILPGGLTRVALKK